MWHDMHPFRYFDTFEFVKLSKRPARIYDTKYWSIYAYIFRMEFVKFHNTSRTIFRFIRLSFSVQWLDISKSRMVHSDWNLTKLSIGFLTRTYNQVVKFSCLISPDYRGWFWKIGPERPNRAVTDQFGPRSTNTDNYWSIWTQRIKRDRVDQFGPKRTMLTNLDP